MSPEKLVPPLVILLLFNLERYIKIIGFGRREVVFYYDSVICCCSEDVKLEVSEYEVEKV